MSGVVLATCAGSGDLTGAAFAAGTNGAALKAAHVIAGVAGLEHVAAVPLDSTLVSAGNGNAVTVGGGPLDLSRSWKTPSNLVVRSSFRTWPSSTVDTPTSKQCDMFACLWLFDGFLEQIRIVRIATTSEYDLMTVAVVEIHLELF